MNIKSVNAGVSLYAAKEKTDLNKKYQDESERSAVGKSKSDSVTISPEAQKLIPVMTNLKNGVYDSKEVMRKLAEKLNKEFPKSE